MQECRPRWGPVIRSSTTHCSALCILTCEPLRSLHKRKEGILCCIVPQKGIRYSHVVALWHGVICEQLQQSSPLYLENKDIDVQGGSPRTAPPSLSRQLHVYPSFAFYLAAWMPTHPVHYGQHSADPQPPASHTIAQISSCAFYLGSQKTLWKLSLGLLTGILLTCWEW